MAERGHSDELDPQGTADTEMGPEKKLCASLVIIDTVHYEGKVVEFDASFLSEETGSAGVKSFKANTTTILKNEPKLDISADLMIDTNEQDSVGFGGR